MFKKKNCPTSNSQNGATNAYQKGYDQVVKDYKALEPFRKYPQRIINVMSPISLLKVRCMLFVTMLTGMKMLSNNFPKISKVLPIIVNNFNC